MTACTYSDGKRHASANTATWNTLVVAPVNTRSSNENQKYPLPCVSVSTVIDIIPNTMALSVTGLITSTRKVLDCEKKGTNVNQQRFPT